MNSSLALNSQISYFLSPMLELIQKITPFTITYTQWKEKQHESMNWTLKKRISIMILQSVGLFTLKFQVILLEQVN